MAEKFLIRLFCQSQSIFTWFFFYFPEPQVHRIETKQAPKPSQPEVVLSDGRYLFEKLSHIYPSG